MSCPVFAVDFQWIWRRESPGAYSRIAWNDMSASTSRRVGLPSRSRTSPRSWTGIATVRGCTNSVVHVVPRVLAAQQADRVGAHGGRRARRR